MARLTGKWVLIAGTVVAVFALGASTQGAPKYTVLHYFTGADGYGPYGGVTLDQKGNLYGTTAGGGTGECGLYTCGTVFKLTPHQNGNWTETVVHSFLGGKGDGSDPWSSLIFDKAGHLYGTTVGGGTQFAGVVFEMTPGRAGWTEHILYAFGAHSNDAYAPSAGPVMDNAGDLYGTGHAAFELIRGPGVWSERVLHHFCSWPDCRDGGGPFAGLILDASGNLYGTTAGGGAGCDGEGCGTVYELTPSAGGGWKERVLHDFDNNGKDGVTPGNGALMMDSWQSLWHNGERRLLGGTVFKLIPGTDGHWKESILHDFKPGASGSFPTAGVVMDKAGNLYGTTVDGGTSCSCGVIYKLAPGSSGKWTYTVLHAFSGGDGAIPAGNLILDDKGNLYGGTVLGGGDNDGVIFQLIP